MLWSVVMVANLVLTMSYLIVISNRYRSDQIATRINANCKVGEVPFPTVSICNFNLVSLRESLSITKILNNYNRSQHEIQNFFRALPNLKDFNYVVQEFEDISEIMDILTRHHFSLDTIMEEIHQTCENLLVYCSFNRKQISCNEMFALIKTYEGYCCAFNYAALNDDRDIVASNNDDIEYYADPSDGYEKTRIISTSQSGSGSGLRVVFNVETADYPPWSLLPYYGAKILISDPNDYPETTVQYKYAVIGKSLGVKVEPLIFQCDDEIRHVSPEKRGCWFHEETILEHTDRYSFETCNTECKMQKFMDACGCIPYKYPKEKSSPVCEFKDLLCLCEYRAFDSKNVKPCSPPCYMECRDKKYSITSDEMPFVPDFFPQKITKNRNVSELTALQVYFTKSTCNCYNKALLIDFNYFIDAPFLRIKGKWMLELINRFERAVVGAAARPRPPRTALALRTDITLPTLSTYGGVFSLSFGASILTAIELLYLLTSTIVNVATGYVCKTVKI